MACRVRRIQLGECRDWKTPTASSRASGRSTRRLTTDSTDDLRGRDDFVLWRCLPFRYLLHLYSLTLGVLNNSCVWVPPAVEID